MRDLLTAVVVLLAPVAWAALCLVGSDVPWQSVKPGALCGMLGSALACVSAMSELEPDDAPLWLMGLLWLVALVQPPASVWRS